MESGGDARVPQPTILAGVELQTTPRFVRLKIHFNGAVPRHTRAVLHGKVLDLFFGGVRKEKIELPRISPRGLIRKIHIRGGSKGVRIRIALRNGCVDYVWYHCRQPPLVIVCLRRSRQPQGIVSHASLPSRRMHSAHPKKGGEEGRLMARGEVQPKVPSRHKPVVAQSKSRKAHGKRTMASKVAAKAALTGSSIMTSPPPEAKAKFAKAREAWKTGHLDLAERMFQEIFQRFPRTREGEASALYWVRSEVRRMKGNQRNGETIARDYESVLKRYPDAPWALMALQELGTLYTRLGRYEQAIITYRRIIEKVPGSSDTGNAYISIGKIQLETRSFRAAEATLQGYLSLFPKGKDTIEASLYLGDALYYQGHFHKAILRYQRALGYRSSVPPTDFKALERLATLFEMRGNRDRALRLLFQVLNLATLDRDRRELLDRIAALYRHMGRVREVATLCAIEKTLFVDPPHRETPGEVRGK